MPKSRFIIKSKVADIDDLTIESEGLTIGRSPENDLLLNHPTVSRTQAGIRDVNGEFWIFNLSDVRRILINGEMADRVPLVDGDVIQIGPFFLKISHQEFCGNCGSDFEAAAIRPEAPGDCPRCKERRRENALFCIQCGYNFQSGTVCSQCGTSGVPGAIFCLNCGVRLEVAQTVRDLKPCKTCGAPRSQDGVYALVILVELQIAVRPLTIESPLSSTIFREQVSMRGKTVFTRRGTQRFFGTGLLTSFLPPEEEQALRIFWDKRKREFGKISAETKLRPKGKERVGKIQYNWRPTGDLQKLWRKSYVSWGIILGSSLSFLSMLLFPKVFWPEELSKAHSSEASVQKAIALKANSGDCLSCHGVSSMQDKCVSCHTTINFDSDVSMAHFNAGLRCVDCHGEHQGQEFRPGLVTAANCASCHRDGFAFGNKMMRTPHGGTVGYPVQNGNWVWKGISAERWSKMNLPVLYSEFTPMEQFHLVHIQPGRRKSFVRCVECHETGIVNKPRFLEAPKESCQGCHALQMASAQTSLAPACTSCHVQHGTDKDSGANRSPFIAFASSISVKNLPPQRSGGAQGLRQDAKQETMNQYAGFSALAWLGVLFSVPSACLALFVIDTFRQKSWIVNSEHAKQPPLIKTGSLDLARIRQEGPSYPYPVVDPLLCIGCHACVEACPHDVLAMVNGISMPVAPDQCMEDTSCEAECPTQPKACVVLNTRKKIAVRKVPKRDQRFITDVPGIYIIGDVAGIPLIKMAINEGAKVLDYIQEDLAKEGANANAEYDVAIVGIGPGGLSATAIAAERKLKYLALEQEQFVSTIQNYPAGKYVFFKPDGIDVSGPIPLPGVGESRELILEQWMRVVKKYDLKIHEEERCKSIAKENGIFSITTERGKTRESQTYKARKIIIAVGNRGAPMKLRVPGEELSTLVPAYSGDSKKCSSCGYPRKVDYNFCPQCAVPYRDQPILLSFCPSCSASLQKEDETMISVQEKSIAFFCRKCGKKVQEVPTEPYYDSKVKYKLSNPDDFVNKKCIVVGGGNSAIEAAVDLCGFKKMQGSIGFTRNNEVTLIVRSDFKGDLKLGNKINIYDCIDSGRVKVLFGAAIKEITEREVIVVNVRSKAEIARLENDYVFALIGGEKPTKFLESIGIQFG